MGHCAQSGGFDTALGFIFFYYTAALGLSGVLVGAALAISLACDAAIDPLVGAWSDGLRSRLGRRLPPMMVAGPLILVFMGLVFSPPRGLSPAGLFAWLALTCVAVRGLISLFNIPYIALGAEIAEGYAERSSVVAWRMGAGIAASVAITALAFSVFFKGEGGLQRAEAYPGFGWSSGLLVFVACASCCLGVRRYAARLPQPVEARRPLLQRLPGEMAEIFRNRSFRLLFASAVIFYVAVGLNLSLQSHVQVFVWRVRPALIQWTTYAYLAGILLGVGLAPSLTRRLEKRTVVMLGLGMVIASWTVLPSLRALGLYTASGWSALWPLVANAVFLGGGVGLPSVAYPSMMADAADEHELLFRARREGLYFSGLTFASKAASGMGTLIGGLALDLIGFPHKAGDPLSGGLSEPMLVRLVLAYGPGAVSVGLVAFAIFFPYAITRARHDAIAAELRLRRAALQ